MSICIINEANAYWSQWNDGLINEFKASYAEVKVQIKGQELLKLEFHFKSSNETYYLKYINIWKVKQGTIIYVHYKYFGKTLTQILNFIKFWRISTS